MPKGPLPPLALHTAHPVPQQRLAMELSGNLHGTKKNIAESQISFHAAHGMAAPGPCQGICNLCISSALTIHHCGGVCFCRAPRHIITCRGRSPPRHMAHGEPGASQGHHGSPQHCSPQPGERKTDLCKGQLMRKLFASRSAGSTGEEQGSSQVARLSDDNKLAQPEHATSSNARLFPLFWENKRGTRLFLARSCPA